MCRDRCRDRCLLLIPLSGTDDYTILSSCEGKGRKRERNEKTSPERLQEVSRPPADALSPPQLHHFLRLLARANAAPRFRHSVAPGPQTTPPRLAVAAAPPEGRGQRDRALPRCRRTSPRLAVVVAIALPENLAGEAWPRVVATVAPRDNRGGPAAPHHLHPPRRRTHGESGRTSLLP